LWPISCAIVEVKDNPFVIGSYYGTKEPKDIETYLEDYIKEATHLTKNGLFLNQPFYFLVFSTYVKFIAKYIQHFYFYSY